MYFIQRRHSLVGQSDGNLFGVCCCEGCCTMTLFAVECEMFLVLTSGERGVLRCVFWKREYSLFITEHHIVAFSYATWCPSEQLCWNYWSRGGNYCTCRIMYAYVWRLTAALASTVLGLYIHTPSCKLCAVLSKAQVQECSYVKCLVSINTVSSKNEKISFAHSFYVAQSSSHKIWLSKKESMCWAFETCKSW